MNNNTIYAELTDEDLLNVQGGGALGKIEYIIKGSTIGGRLGGVKGAIPLFPVKQLILKQISLVLVNYI
jgi:hypothetical protein